ncbi:MAG TPA: flavin-dependent oxidoreductase [Burkholderiales bacterium]|nr:flavin-dependent oxidoreductase [Burkholderiales bacterium]
MRSENARDVLIIGGGVTGLTLALSLHEARIPCRVYEAAAELKWHGVGINLLPHAVRELTELGLAGRLERRAVLTREMCFYNRFGQFVYKEPRGRYAGYDWPQFSIHRGELHRVLVDAVRERLGADSVALGHRCETLEQDAGGVTASFAGRAPVRGAVAIACDGIHSAVRRQLYPDEGPPVYSGINMWRGVTRWKPYLSGESFVQCGWLDVGKIVVYPIGREPDEQGRQLITWTAEFRSPRNVQADWNLNGRLADFLPTFESFRFEWLDVAEMLRNAEVVLEYPMVDRDPVPRWTFGRVTLVGDAAHPMHPRGANGAAQGILDARTLAGCLARGRDPVTALEAYEKARLKPANEVVLASRSISPDTILRLVHERTGDKPFERVEDVVSGEELAALMEKYKRVAGFEREALKKRPSLVSP